MASDKLKKRRKGAFLVYQMPGVRIVYGARLICAQST